MDDDPYDLADVRAVLDGDPEPFARIVRRHQGPVRAVLRGHLGRTPDLDDLAQEVFLRAWRALASWRPARGTLRTWLLAIARNRARDLLRRRAVRPVETAWARDADAGPDPPAEADVRDLVEGRLDGALAALAPERRVAFLLAEVHGLPLGEVARIEGVPLGTVKSRLDRARKALREALSSDAKDTP